MADQYFGSDSQKKNGLHICIWLIPTKLRKCARSPLYSGVYAICPRSSDPIYIVSYYIKWVTTSWTHSIVV